MGNGATSQVSGSSQDWASRGGANLAPLSGGPSPVAPYPAPSPQRIAIPEEDPLPQGLPGLREVGDKTNSARITFYTPYEDKWGSQTAYPGLSGKRMAGPGTVAVDPSLIPPGTLIQIPAAKGYGLDGGDTFLAHDTGSAVKSRQASGGKEPVIDIFLPKDNREMMKIASGFPRNAHWSVLKTPLKK